MPSPKVLNFVLISRVFAKKTLLMTAKKVGVKPKGNPKKQKYVLKNWVPGSGGTLPPNTKYGSPLGGNDGDDVSRKPKISEPIPAPNS